MHLVKVNDSGPSCFNEAFKMVKFEKSQQKKLYVYFSYSISDDNFTVWNIERTYVRNIHSWYLISTGKQ